MELALVRPLSEPAKVSLLVRSEGFSVTAGQILEVRVGEAVISALVIATPKELVQARGEPSGEVIGVRPTVSIDTRSLAISRLKAHPATSFPCLGQVVGTADLAGHVVGLDIPRGTITVQLPDGQVRTVSIPKHPE